MHCRTKSLFLGFYFALFCLLDVSCFEKGSSFNVIKRNLSVSIVKWLCCIILHNDVKIQNVFDLKCIIAQSLFFYHQYRGTLIEAYLSVKGFDEKVILFPIGQYVIFHKCLKH